VKLISQECRITTVGLSGGVFQNKLLSMKAIELLKEERFTVLENGNVPVNDWGICVGQTYIALHTQ